MNDFTQVGKKESSPRRQNLSSFFSSIVAFCRHFCRLYARALVSKEEEERSPSFFLSLSLSLLPALCSTASPREATTTVREEKEKEKEAGRRLLSFW